MRVRRLCGVVVCLTVSTWSVSCGRPAPSSPSQLPGEASGPVDVLLFGSPTEIKAYRELVAAFITAHPDHEVRLIEAADRDDLLTRLSTSFAGGTPPDLFLINYRFYKQFAAKGVLEPLGPKLDSSTVFRQADFFDVALNAFRSAGVIQCMPQNVSSLVVYVNKNMFTEAGLALPAGNWTWDELLVAAKALTKDRDGDGAVDQYGLGVEPSVIRLAPMVWSAGGEVVDDPERPTRFTLDSPASKRALQFFLDLKFVHNVIPNELEFEATDNETRFVNGRLGMTLQSRRSTSLFRSIKNFDWDVVALPTFDEPAGILHADGYCIPKASRRQAAAWRFLEFAVGPEGAPVLARTGRTVPSLISVANSDAFLNPEAKPANSKTFVEGIPSIRPLPAVSTWPAIEKEADLIIEVGLWRERKPAEQLAQELDTATSSLFARAER